MSRFWSKIINKWQNNTSWGRNQSMQQQQQPPSTLSFVSNKILEVMQICMTLKVSILGASQYFDNVSKEKILQYCTMLYPFDPPPRLNSWAKKIYILLSFSLLSVKYTLCKLHLCHVECMGATVNRSPSLSIQDELYWTVMWKHQNLVVLSLPCVKYTICKLLSHVSG